MYVIPVRHWSFPFKIIALVKGNGIAIETYLFGKYV